MIKEMLEEEEHVEKVPTPKHQQFYISIWKFIRQQPAYQLALSAFADPITIIQRSFWVKKVDRGILPQAAWFEIHPNKPNGKAILLCHGFGSTPEMFEDVAPILANLGYYVRAIRLSGHGTTAGHLAQTTGTDWFASVVWHYQEIQEEYEEINFIGHSLGGTMGLLLATIYRLNRLILIASPIKLHIPPAKLARQASIFIKYWPRSRASKKKFAEAGYSTYTKSPLYATAGVFDVCAVARKKALLVNNDILYIKAGLDHKTFQDQDTLLQKYFTKAHIIVKVASQTPHTAFLGPEFDQLADWIFSFLNGENV